MDERLTTTAAGIWALGEAAGSPMFTHVALDDYRIAKSVILGGNRTTRARLVPYAVFIEPELGRVGLSGTEARPRGIAVRVATLPMGAVPRARTLSQTRGLMKAIVAGTTTLSLASPCSALQRERWSLSCRRRCGRRSLTMFRDGIIAHPTIAEGLNLLFAKVPAATG